MSYALRVCLVTLNSADLGPHAYYTHPHSHHHHIPIPHTHRLPTGAEYLFSARDGIKMMSWVDAINGPFRNVRHTCTHA